jgi:methylglutamate dehydrogenase subunit C
MTVSAPEVPLTQQPFRVDERRVGLKGPHVCDMDVVEIAPLRGREAEMRHLIEARGSTLPPVGHVEETAHRRVLCVRPGRWLLLESRREPGMSAAKWEGDCRDVGTVVDLSSALGVLALTGPAVRQVLARGCRLDLDSAVFAVGRAARTLIAQVPVILVAHSAGVLLLTPSTTAGHFIEWLNTTARPFRILPGGDLDPNDFAA